jgi:hypothetical protein
MLDFDNLTRTLVAIAGLTPFNVPTDYHGLSYDKVSNRLLLLGIDRPERRFYYWSIPLPIDPENTARYAATRINVPLDSSVTLGDTFSTYGTALFYGNVRFIPGLDVITINRTSYPVIGFRPKPL